jgi:hypothetical protein
MLSVSVSSVAIDTTAAERDIKPPLSVPWSWQEIAVIIGIILGISGLIYLFYRYRKKKWLEQDVMGVEMPKTPPHILAIDRLRELDLKRLWQQGRVKEFYSEATEIIRQYFEQRYGFLALEMTSDEILEELSKHDIQDAVVAMASGMLRKADLVKFAKHLPVAAENEEIVPKGLDIVEKSKPVIMLDDHV